MDLNANIWGSGINDPTTWVGNIYANVIPGAAMALATQASLIVAFKSESVEFFYDAGNALGLPISPVPNTAIQWGCVNGNSVQTIEDRIFWLATSKQTRSFIAVLTNRQPNRISTPGIERLLESFSGTIWSFSMRDQGHTYYGITSVGGNLTLVYDISQAQWYVWTDPNGNYWPWYGFAGSSSDISYCQSSLPTLGNNIYGWDDSYTTDNGVMNTVDIYTGNYDSGSRRRDVLQRMDFIADQLPGKLQVRHSQDDFKHFSGWRYVDLNVQRPSLIDCGDFRRRCWNFRWQEPYRLRLEAVELTILQGVA